MYIIYIYICIVVYIGLYSKLTVMNFVKPLDINVENIVSRN